MKYLRINYIKEIEHSELDIENLENIFGKSDDYHEHETLTTQSNGSNMYWTGEAEPINIDTLMNTLQTLKDAGCNYVEVMFHCDHIGYNITGLEMREASKEEVNKYRAHKRSQLKIEKENKIKELEEALNKLKK